MVSKVAKAQAYTIYNLTYHSHHLSLSELSGELICARKLQTFKQMNSIFFIS